MSKAVREAMQGEFTPSLRSSEQVSGAPEGFDAHFVAALCETRKRPLIWVVRDDSRLAAARAALAFFAPQLKRIVLPAYDCLPYDRLSPHPAIAARRAAALGEIVSLDARAPAIILAPLAAALQKLPPKAELAQNSLLLRRGHEIKPETLRHFLSEAGYMAVDHVAAPGEYAIRGGLADIFSPAQENPCRIDFFGNQIEAIRLFRVEDQRSCGTAEVISLTPASELRFDEAARRRFCASYAARFGVDRSPLYTALAAGSRMAGQEHWLPLFYETTGDLFSFLPEAPVVLDNRLGVDEERRRDLIEACYQSRHREAEDGHATGQVLPPDACHLSLAKAEACLSDREVLALSPFPAASGQDAGGYAGPDFTSERLSKRGDLFAALKKQQMRAEAEGKRFILAAWSEGSKARMSRLLEEHGLHGFGEADSWPEIQRGKAPVLVQLQIEEGFEGKEFLLIGEQDIFGQRLGGVTARRGEQEKRDLFIRARAFRPGDLVVHIDHGVGRFEGLQQIEADGAVHDCFEIIYAEERKLFLPVENADLISRHGSSGSEGEQALDRLGGAGWQARRAKVKKRLKVMASHLIARAAVRAKAEAPVIEPPQGIYEEFCARFPFEETPDQKQSMESVLEDMASGKLMDRLVCGDAGFGKTEIALRAAFCHAMAGKQTALIAPTTLLVRQHLEVFRQRFSGFPVEVAGLSRLISVAEAKRTKERLAAGEIDIVIGTHALLSKSIAFKRLGLVVNDEEQHFGVAHKERLKEFGEAVNILTLSATPIPRSLQMALAGARDMSVIATPPQGRLAVKTFTGVFDPPALTEALRREKSRGGQSFFVCPHRRDLERVEYFLKRHVPELSYITAHGQLPPQQLESQVAQFYDGKCDILLSTPIVESGLDIPRANTIIIYRSHMFGMAQAYQLRGRVGRARIPGYAYLTVPHEGVLHGGAGERLKVLQSLTQLGAGFNLAAQDLDMRGAGNLLGAEQSGHVREVGYELYQDMLTEAMAQQRGESAGEEAPPSPVVRIDASALIPETYIASLDARLDVYRRLARLEKEAEIEPFAAELIDRFGALPEQTEQLLDTVRLKALCREAGVARLEAGGQKVAVRFHEDSFPNPAGLAALIQSRPQFRLHPDHRLILETGAKDSAQQMHHAAKLLAELKTLRQNVEQAV